jgi:lysophospholipase L1-like esterase
MGALAPRRRRHERCNGGVTASRSRGRAAARMTAALVLAVCAAAVTLEALLRIEARGLSVAALGPWEERRPWEAIRQAGPDGIKRPVPSGRAEWRLQPWHRPVEYRLDEHGFRLGRGAASFAGGQASMPAACRVLAVGDSHTFGYGVPAEHAWPGVVATMVTRVTVANGALCGSGIPAEQAWLPDAIAAARPHVVVLAVTPWSLREDPEPPALHALDPRWPRVDAYFRRLTRLSAVADRLSRVALPRSAALLGWPPPASVLWELVPLLEPPAAFRARWRGVERRLAHMVRDVRRTGATPIVLFIPLDVQVSEARNALYRGGRLPYRTHGFVDRDYTRDGRYTDVLARTAVRLDVQLVDATPFLRATAPEGFLSDSYHLSPAGHSHVAALIAGPIARACGEVPALVPVGTPAPDAPAAGIVAVSGVRGR